MVCFRWFFHISLFPIHDIIHLGVHCNDFTFSCIVGLCHGMMCIKKKKYYALLHDGICILLDRAMIIRITCAGNVGSP